MVFRWLVAVLNNCISTNDCCHFELFRFFNQKIALVTGLANLQLFAKLAKER